MMQNPTNSPLMALVMAAKRGGNPVALMQQMAVQNPQVNMALQMMQGKTPQQLEQLARNMAKERNTTVEDLARSLGIQIPSSR